MTAVSDALIAAQTPVRRCDAATWGLSRRGFDRLVARGAIVEVVHGVYLTRDHADDLQCRAQAVALTLPDGAAVSRRTAAWLWDVDTRTPAERGCVLPVECAVPVGRTPVRRPGVLGYVTDLRPEDVTWVHGVPCTTATRTAVDLARWLEPHMGLATLDALAAAGLVDPERLLADVERWRGCRFVDRARRLIGLCEPRTESFGESWLRLRVVDAGFPRPEVQIWVSDDDGVAVYRLDMGWRHRRFGLEYDGEEFHSSDDDRRADDVRRQDLQTRFGWDVLGVGRGEVLGRSLALELAVGGVLGLEPTIRRRMW